MIISKIKNYKGVIAFYFLIIASVFLLSARIDELNKNKITKDNKIIASIAE